MIPVIAVVGYANTGKTTLLTKLIAELTWRKYRVGTIKHHHTDFEADQPGKDTWKHAEAGAMVTLLAMPTRMTKYVRAREEITLERALREVSGVDIILVEGFKDEKMPKIEIVSADLFPNLITPREDLLAVVSDRGFPDIPSYQPDDAKGICDLIEKRFLQ